MPILLIPPRFAIALPGAAMLAVGWAAWQALEVEPPTGDPSVNSVIAFGVAGALFVGFWMLVYAATSDFSRHTRPSVKWLNIGALLATAGLLTAALSLNGIEFIGGGLLATALAPGVLILVFAEIAARLRPASVEVPAKRPRGPITRVARALLVLSLGVAFDVLVYLSYTGDFARLGGHGAARAAGGFVSTHPALPLMALIFTIWGIFALWFAMDPPKGGGSHEDEGLRS